MKTLMELTGQVKSELSGKFHRELRVCRFSITAHPARWSDVRQKTLLQTLGVNFISSAAEYLHDTFGRAESRLFLVFSQVIAGFFNGFEADTANLLEVRATLMDFTCFVPGSINEDYLLDTGQIASRFV